MIDNELLPGDIFDTLYESGCVVISSPDSAGSFLAYDGDDVECSFGVSMVRNPRRPVALYSTRDHEAYIDLTNNEIVYELKFP